MEVNPLTEETPNPAPNLPPAPEVKQTWMPTTVGILTVIAGVGDLLLGLLALVLIHFAHRFGLGLIGIPHIILGIVAIVGGVFALLRKTWWLALLGTICALMWPSTLFGILSIVFVSLSRREFK
jgi:hypothetical protein